LKENSNDTLSTLSQKATVSLIHLIDDFLRQCLDITFFDKILQFTLVFAIASLAYVTFFNIPLGKAYKPGRPFLKIEFPDKPAFILAHFICYFIFACEQLFYPNEDIFSIPSIVCLSSSWNSPNTYLSVVSKILFKTLAT
jgi:hypothetical protein